MMNWFKSPILCLTHQLMWQFLNIVGKVFTILNYALIILSHICDKEYLIIFHRTESCYFYKFLKWKVYPNHMAVIHKVYLKKKRKKENNAVPKFSRDRALPRIHCSTWKKLLKWHRLYISCWHNTKGSNCPLWESKQSCNKPMTAFYCSQDTGHEEDESVRGRMW